MKMKIKLGLLLIALSTSALLLNNAFAHGSEGHGMSSMKMNCMKMDCMKMEMDMPKANNRVAAFNALVKGIDMMEKTGSDKYIKEMLSNGPIMNQWHVTMQDIYDALEVLEGYSDKLSKDKSLKLNSAMEKLSDVLDGFHMLTHDKNDKDAQAAIAVKVKEARDILSDIKSYL